MEKLIELLQEYLNSEVFKKDVSGNDNVEDIPDVKLTRYFNDRFYCTYISDTEFEIPTDTVISKRYRFIKWLVENDKIDKKKLDEAERKPMYITDDMFSLYKIDECVIMLLSISENPIDDLISYLK